MANNTLATNVAQAITDFNSIKSIIVENGVDIPSGTPTSEYANKINDVASLAEENTISDYCYAGNTRTNFVSAFAFSGWEGTIKMYNSNNGTNFSNCFQGAHYIREIEIDLSNITYAYMMFGLNSTNMKKITLLNMSSAGRPCDVCYMFYKEGGVGGATIEEITGFNFSYVTNLDATFRYEAKLKVLGVLGELKIGGLDLQHSILLNHDSIVGIINSLSTSVTEKGIALSLTAVKKAFETSEGANDGNASEEWTNLLASKANWTINLL